MTRARFFHAVILLLLASLLVLPTLWLILCSFKQRIDLLSLPPMVFFAPTLEHYSSAFGDRGFFSHSLNSLIVAVLSSTLAVLVGYPAALVLTRKASAASDHVLFLILSTRLVPPVALGVPLYFLYRDWALLDTRTGLVIAHAAFNISFAVWMVAAYLRRLSREVFETAILDGLGPWRLTWALAPAMFKPLTMVWLFCFVFSWNEYFLGSVLATNNARTLPVATLGLVTSHGTYWGQICAVAVVALAPVLLFALALRPAAGTLFSLGGVDSEEGRP